MSHSEIEEPPSKRAKISDTTDDEIPGQSLTNGNASSTGNQSSSATQDSSTNAKELEVGIATYVTDEAVELKATLKKRYTDFLVNEILPNGKVVHLTQLGVPEALRAKKAATAKLDPANNKPVKDVHSVEVSREGPLQNGAVSGHDITTENKVENKVDESKSPTGQHQTSSSSISEDDKQKLISYLNEKAVSELLVLHQSILDNPRAKHSEHPTVKTEFTADRSLRSQIHQFIREKFSSRIESSTDKDGMLVLLAAKPGVRSNRPQKNGGKSGRPEKLGWADRGGEYLHFTLYKENKDTMEAISYLVKQMRLNAKAFQFAGTKDRRAVTAQRVSAHRIDMERLASASRSLRNSSLGDFEYQSEGLELGDLAGNEFTITLRDGEMPGIETLGIDEKVAVIRQHLETAMDRLYNHGYLNYFGLQRFGTFITRTDTTGLHILKGDFKAACDSILYYDQDSVPTKLATDTTTDTNNHAPPQPFLSDDQKRSEALDHYKATADLHKALDILPRKFSAEQTVLRHLHRQPQDFFGALMAIHRNLRLMYIHAYQSLVWNHAVTHRWKTHGARVVEGDLVLVHEHTDKGNHPDNESSKNTDATPALDADGDPIILPTATGDSSSSSTSTYERARALTASEASSNTYSIFDIVMPLPGFDVEYPSNSSGDFYATFMKEHGGLDPRDMRRKQRDFSLSGGYRKVLSRVLRPDGDGEASEGVRGKVEVYAYEKDDEQFVKTDMEILLAKKKAAAAAAKNDENENGTKDTEMPDAADADADATAASQPSKVAAVLKFQLGSSQYATMALRELSRGGIKAFQPEYK